MKHFLICLLLISTPYCKGQDCSTQLYHDTYTWVDFCAEPWNGEWPIDFTVLLKNDTIFVDVNDEDSFIRSVYSQGLFVPDCLWNPKIFARFFGKDWIHYWINEVSKFENFTYDLSTKYRKKDSITLKNQRKINYSYYEISGFFAYLDKQTDLKYVGPSSNGIQDTSLIVGDITMPIAVTNIYFKLNPIVLKQDY